MHTRDPDGIRTVHTAHVRTHGIATVRRLDAACHSVASTIGAQGDRPLAGLQAAASLLVHALADRRVRALDEAARGWCAEFGGDCLPWHRLAEVLGPSLGSAGRRAVAAPPYTLVPSAQDLDEAVLCIATGQNACNKILAFGGGCSFSRGDCRNGEPCSSAFDCRINDLKPLS